MHPSARHDGLITRETGDELIVYDLKRHRVHRLNRSAALVYRHADGHSAPAALAAKLRPELGDAANEALVLVALDKLSRARLLEEPFAPELPMPERRRLLKAAGLAGGFALLAPVVVSMLAPTPAQAQTGCGAAGAPCTTDADCCTTCDILNGVCN